MSACARFAGVLTACALSAAMLPAMAQTGAPARGVDERRSLTAGFFTGLAIDTFSVSDLEEFRNQDDSGTVRERGIAGFDFEFRLAGHPDDDRQLWIYGETVHGVRSADIDCRKTPQISICRDDDVADPNAALAIIRNATSLEGFIGLRWEFLRIQNDADAPTRLYLKAEEGFVSVTGDNRDAAQVNRIALGLVRTGGRYKGSYLDLGYGTSEYLLARANGRYKVDGFLTWKPALIGKVMSPFAELTADVDLGDGPDSITTYLGIDFDLDLLFGK